MTAPARQPQIFKAIKIEKPYEAIALIDGWLCIKYLDGGEESLSTFADVSKGDIIRFGHTTHTSPPAPEVCEEQDACRIPAMCPEVTKAAKAEREKDIAKVQTKLNESKKNLYGFDAKEAEWINGFEAGLDAAIDTLRAQQQAGEP